MPYTVHSARFSQQNNKVINNNNSKGYEIKKNIYAIYSLKIKLKRYDNTVSNVHPAEHGYIVNVTIKIDCKLTLSNKTDQMFCW